MIDGKNTDKNLNLEVVEEVDKELVEKYIIQGMSNPKSSKWNLRLSICFSNGDINKWRHTYHFGNFLTFPHPLSRFFVLSSQNPWPSIRVWRHLCTAFEIEEIKHNLFLTVHHFYLHNFVESQWLFWQNCYLIFKNNQDYITYY